jgi:hypothetical protein
VILESYRITALPNNGCQGCQSAPERGSSSIRCHRTRIVLGYGYRDRGERDHDHEEVEQQRHARGKPDIDITSLSKEYTREQWNQTGVATTERGEQRRRDRHTESGTQGRGHFVDAGRGPSFVIWDIRKRGVRRWRGVEAESDAEKSESEEGDELARRNVQLVKRIPHAVIVLPKSIGFRAPMR